jgi:Rha family phage regulatory protein
MHLDNIVFIHQGRVLTDSLKLASAFDKDHKSVLRAIEHQLPLYSEKFTSAHFCAHVRDVPGPNGAVRQEKFYQLTRNAFMVVGMSFTGPKAAAFRETIIERFTEMEEELARLGRPQDNSIDTLLAAAEKRAYSAMGRLSAAVRQFNGLEREFTEVSCTPTAAAQALVGVDFTTPIRLNGNDRVDLRKVWEALKSGDKFTDWADRYLADFDEGQDYGSFRQPPKQRNDWRKLNGPPTKHIHPIARPALIHPPKP